MREDTFYVANKVCVINGANQVLLLQTPSGAWELPGGHNQHGENPLEALRRELSEETGCSAQSAELVSARTDGDIVTLFWRALCDEQVQVSDEHTDHAWVSRKSISSYTLKHGDVLRDLIIRIADW